jgi:transcriptional regulator with XRE-family HTH domain
MMEKYAELIRAATGSANYWTQSAMREFVVAIIDRMEKRDISKAKLAQSMGVSPAYVSKAMRGNVNFTLESMVKFALATGGRVRIQIDDQENMRSETRVVHSATSRSVTTGLSSSGTLANVIEFPTTSATSLDWTPRSATQSGVTKESDYRQFRRFG